MDIGKRIKKIRTQKGLSTYEISRKTGISQSAVSRLENGKRKADADIIEKIAEALEVSPDKLTGKALSDIIGDRLKELGMSLEELAEKSGSSLSWLQTIDSYIPGEFGGYENGYETITKVADVLGLPSSMLRAALARQEIPIFDEPVLSAKDAFKQAQDGFKEPHPESPADMQEQPYYFNDETRQIAQEVFDNPQLRSLFHAARDISPERLKTQIDYLKFLKAQEKGDADEGC